MPELNTEVPVSETASASPQFNRIEIIRNLLGDDCGITPEDGEYFLEDDHRLHIFLSQYMKNRLFLARGIRDSGGITDKKKQRIMVAKTTIRDAREKLSWEEETGQDYLTGLNNRNGFTKKVSRSLQTLIEGKRKNQPINLVFMIWDIDNFKQVNDHLGHLAGDAVLRKIAELLNLNFQESIDILGRWGGEEFGIFMPLDGLEDDAIRQLVENKRALTSDQIKPEDLVTGELKERFNQVKEKFDGLIGTLSAGTIVCSRKKILEMQEMGYSPLQIIYELTRQADELLGQAKNKGKNQLLFARLDEIPPIVPLEGAASRI